MKLTRIALVVHDLVEEEVVDVLSHCSQVVVVDIWSDYKQIGIVVVRRQMRIMMVMMGMMMIVMMMMMMMIG